MNKSESLINCNTCKVRKLKCARELPNCSYCLERGIICTYSQQIRRRRVGIVGAASSLIKVKVGSSTHSHKVSSRDSKMKDIQIYKYILFQPIPQPINFVDENSQAVLAKLQSNGNQKFLTHTLLKLSNQIVEYDTKLIPQIDFFLGKLELGVLGGLLKFSIHMNQEWIIELLNPTFEEKCITSYFRNFHHMATYISKYKFYTNYNLICPVLKSVVILAGYSSVSKKSPELLKYLRHVAIVQLKKNMLNIRVSICQALFVFSHYLTFQGLTKQSLKYFHQAYLMASALGIHVDIPELNEMDKDERRCIRFNSYIHDSYLVTTASTQPLYLFLAPSWAPLNPIYQTNPYSKDHNEFLIAECICLSKKCFSMYWIILGNLMNKYLEIILTNSQTSLIYSNTRVIHTLQILFNHSLIQILDLHLNLSGKCKNSEELEIVKNFAKMHVILYYNSIIALNSQFSPSNLTPEFDQSTKKLLWSAQGLFQNSVEVNPICVHLLYQSLCSIALLYIKLILIYNYVPQLKELLLEKLKQVYELFNSYRTKYKMSSDFTEIVGIITSYHKIKLG
jgi:hypothetical protein